MHRYICIDTYVYIYVHMPPHHMYICRNKHKYICLYIYIHIHIIIVIMILVNMYVYIYIHVTHAPLNSLFSQPNGMMPAPRSALVLLGHSASEPISAKHSMDPELVESPRFPF